VAVKLKLVYCDCEDLT